MDSWWQLGEGMGKHGTKLSLGSIVCAFCGERGNFQEAFHAEKKKPNSGKKLNFEIYKCNNCAGYVHVLWSASEHAFPDRGQLGKTLQDRALSVTEFPEMHVSARCSPIFPPPPGEWRHNGVMSSSSRWASRTACNELADPFGIDWYCLASRRRGAARIDELSRMSLAFHCLTEQQSRNHLWSAQSCAPRRQSCRRDRRHCRLGGLRHIRRIVAGAEDSMLL
jgi:hypothetical protein